MKKRSQILPVAFLVSFLVVAVHSQTIQAQDANIGTAAEQTATGDEQPIQHPTRAVWWSIGSTALVSAVGGGLMAANSESVQVAGAITIGTGAIFLPSIAQWNSGRWVRGALFTFGRAGFVSLITFGWLMNGIAENCGLVRFGPCTDPHESSMGIAMIAVGSMALAALTVWDIYDSYSLAKKYEEEHAKKSISVSPLILPSANRNGGNGTAYGLAVAGNF